MRAVAQRIKKEREKQGKTTEQVAYILGVIEQEVIDIENGKTQLTMRDIDEFALALDVNPCYLKFGEKWQNNVNAQFISQSNIDKPKFENSNVATNTATHMTTNNYYADNVEMQSQIEKIAKEAHAGRLGAISQMDRIEEQLKLLHEKIDFLMIVGENQ